MWHYTLKYIEKKILVLFYHAQCRTEKEKRICHNETLIRWNNNIDINGTAMLITKGTGLEKQHDLEAHLATSGSFRGGYGQVIISPFNFRSELFCHSSDLKLRHSHTVQSQTALL